MTDASGSKGAAPVIKLGDLPGSRIDDRILIPPHAGVPQRPPSDVVWTLNGQVFGSDWSVRAVPAPGTDQGHLTRLVQDELDALAAIFDHTQPSAEVARFNATEPGAWSLSSDLWDLLNTAMDIGDDTNGAVDPTLGAVAALWAPTPDGRRVPTDAEIDAALALSGWQDFRLIRDHRAALQRGGNRLDFSGFLRGHAAERVSRCLTEAGATSHLVDVCGALKGVGVRPDGQPWWVQIALPPGLVAPRTVVGLIELAMATATELPRDTDGHRSRVLDGRNGRPVDNGLVAVTVLHASALQADALSTALLVMGPDDGPGYAATLGIAAHFVERSSRGLIEGVSPAMADMMEDEPPAEGQV